MEKLLASVETRNYMEFKEACAMIEMHPEKICPICYHEKQFDNVICGDCNKKGFIEIGVKFLKIRKQLDELLEGLNDGESRV